MRVYTESHPIGNDSKCKSLTSNRQHVARYHPKLETRNHLTQIPKTHENDVRIIHRTNDHSNAQ